jgi:hypothetical protein
MAGFIPAIHVFLDRKQTRRGCPARGRARQTWAEEPISFGRISSQASRITAAIAMNTVGHEMDIDLPDVIAEVSAQFARYEAALVSNDVAVLDELFRADKRTLRYGIGENLYGYDAIMAFRAGRSPVGLMRKTAKTVITSYGRDTAVASTLFYREATPGKVGRQMQTWVRFAEGWRIVAAHVSVIDEPRGPPA